jgi:hypothetical protein
MSLIRQGLALAIAANTFAFASAAMAGKNGTPGANLNAPGQANSSPGQLWQSQKSDPSALSPGQTYNTERALNPDTPPPGQTFNTLGQPNRVP